MRMLVAARRMNERGVLGTNEIAGSAAGGSPTAAVNGAGRAVGSRAL